jgi:NarL family two-component system response regulator LiaR
MPNQSDDKIKVLLVDDHGVVRRGLRMYLELQNDVEIVGEATNGLEAVEQVRKLHPDVVLMDLVMPKMDGIEATRQICALGMATKVIALTSFAEDDKIFPAIRAGAVGYLLKDVSPADLVAAIRTAQRGGSPLQPEIAKKLMGKYVQETQEPGLEELTERELEVLRLLSQGLTNRQIAQKLVISEKTAKAHLGNILGKLHLTDRTQAAIYALKKGIIPEP